MKAIGILLILASLLLLLYAWAGPQPGDRTVTQTMDHGVWKTVKVDDESLPVRWTYSYAAAGVFILGTGLVVLPRLARKGSAPAVAGK